MLDFPVANQLAEFLEAKSISGGVGQPAGEGESLGLGVSACVGEQGVFH